MATPSALSTHLANILKAEFERVRSYSALEQRIADSLPERAEKGDEKGKGGTVVTRKQLRNLIKEPQAKVRLSMTQIDALDVYFRKTRNRSLVSLLSDYDFGLLKAISRSSDATFMIGERPTGTGLGLSRWDFRAMVQFLRAFYADAGHSDIEFELMDVPLLKPVDLVTEERFELAKWLGELEEVKPIICLGSPRSCHAAEVMLARMFNLKSFDENEAQGADVPFFFSWERDGSFPHSCCLCTPRAPLRYEQEGTMPEWANRAIRIIDGEESKGFRDYPVARIKGEHWVSYGITVVQRRPRSEQVWAVFCGLSGPETLGAAKMAAELRMPPSPEGDVAPVAWTLTKTKYSLEEPTNPASHRRETETIIEDQGVWWPS